MEYSPLLGGFAVVLADGRGGFLSADTANFECSVSNMPLLFCMIIIILITIFFIILYFLLTVHIVWFFIINGKISLATWHLY